MLSGSLVALVTPFKNNRIDEAGLKRLVDFHVEAGTHGLVPCGTTGESATLTHEEHNQVVKIVVKAARGRIPVIAGAGSNSTSETIRLVRSAQAVGADGALLIAPYYNRPTQDGLYRHYQLVAKSSKLPLILYNIPSRTGVNVLPSTIIRLARECKTILGVKESSGVMDQSSEILEALGTQFTLLAGDDALTLPLLAMGAKGVISVAANIVPGAMADLCESWQRGDPLRARTIHYQLFPLIKALFLETNPVPVKTAMGLMKLCSPDVRLPLTPLGNSAKAALVKVLKERRLIKGKA